MTRVWRAPQRGEVGTYQLTVGGLRRVGLVPYLKPSLDYRGVRPTGLLIDSRKIIAVVHVKVAGDHNEVTVTLRSRAGVRAHPHQPIVESNDLTQSA